MKRIQLTFTSIAIALLIGGVASMAAGEAKEAPVVVLKTSLGDITLELDAEKAPISVENFLSYVDDGFYDGTVFHRVIPNFMIQGGGFPPDMSRKETKPAIVNEADNGLKNERGTIAMARLPAKDTATAQFFINLVDNGNLDHSARNFGYAVFGRVTDGIEIVDKIAAVKTGSRGGHQDVPVEPILIESAKRQ